MLTHKTKKKITVLFFAFLGLSILYYLDIYNHFQYWFSPSTSHLFFISFMFFCVLTISVGLLLFPSDRLGYTILPSSLDAPSLAKKKLDELIRFFDESHELHCITNSNGYFLRINSSFTRLLGHSSQTLLTKPIISFVHPSDQAKTIHAFKQLRVGHPIKQFKNRYRCANGEYRWLEWHATANASNDVYYASAHDVTDAVQTTQALEESEQRFRAIFNTVDDGIILQDDQAGLMREVNQHACDIYGYTHKQLAQLRFVDLSSGKQNFTPTNAQSYLDQARKQKESLCFEWHAMNAQGKLFWIAAHVKHIKVGNESCFILSVRDISARKISEEKLKLSEARLSEAQHIAQLGWWSLDMQTGEEDWSHQVYHLLDLPLSTQPSFEKLVKAIHQDDSPFVTKHYHEAIENHETKCSAEFRVVRPDGEVRHMQCIANFQWLADEMPPIVLGTIQDITKSKQAEQQRLLLEEGLRHAQKIEAVGTLASGIAHDFNNLLTAISGYVELIKSKTEATDITQKYLKMIDKVIVQAAGVNRSLLTFSHKAPTEKRPLDLKAMIHETLQLLKRLLPASVELKEDMPSDQPVWINGDPTQLQRVLMNLAVNARDAMPDGGIFSVHLETNTSHANKSNDDLSAVHTSAILTISDTGHGIAQEMIGRIFDPFFTSKARGEGTGLGLAVAHGVIQDHGGSIEVQSDYAGTTFYIKLPIVAQPTTAKQITLHQDTPHALGQMIILAEDNDYVREIMTSSLETAGYNVHATADGQQFVETAQENGQNTHVFIIDLDLPKRSGLSCMHVIEQVYPNRPIVIVTGNDNTPELDTQAANLYLLKKPFQMCHLVSLVGKICQ